MKNICLLLIFSFCLNQLKAQITYTHHDLPSANEVIPISVSFYNPDFFDAKISGNGPLNFDFSEFHAFEIDSIKFLDPASTQYGDTFPNANIILENDEANMYIEKSEAGFNVVGLTRTDYFVENGFLHTKMDPTFMLMQTPVTLKSSYSDEGEFVFVKEDTLNGSYFYVEIHARTGRSMSINNYGTLKMPNDSIFDVLVAYVSEYRFDSTITEIAGERNTQIRMVETQYAEFLAKGYGLPLIRAQYSEDYTRFVSVEYLRMPGDEKFMLGTDLISEADFAIYPNPVQNLFTVQTKNPFKLVKVLTLNGKELIQSSKPQISVDGLQSGIYLVELISLDGTISRQKIVVQ